MRELKIIFKDGTIAIYLLPKGVDHNMYLRHHGEIYMKEAIVISDNKVDVLVSNCSE